EPRPRWRRSAGARLSFRREARRASVEEDLPQQRNRQAALRHERVVELLEAGALLLPVLVAQLLDLELAERVVEVRRVGRAAARLLESVRRLLESLLDEHLRTLLDRHALSVQLDADHVATVAQQRLLELSQANLGVPVPEALVHHHLLGVVRPALGVRAAE